MAKSRKAYRKYYTRRDKRRGGVKTYRNKYGMKKYCRFCRRGGCGPLCLAPMMRGG